METDNINAVSAETSAPSEFTQDDAAAHLLNLLGGDEEENTDETPSSSDPEPDDAATAEVETAGEAEPDSDPEPEEETRQERRERLRDGTEVTIGELKKAYGERQELQRQQEAFTAQQREWQAKQAQLTQQEQLFQQTLPQAIALLQQQVPPPPDPDLIDTDIIEYQTQMAKRNLALTKLNQLQNARVQYDQQQSAAFKAQQDEYMSLQRQELARKLPELADPVKAQEWLGKFTRVATETYGFAPEELDRTKDHRVLLMAADALKWRELQANKPKALEKAKDAPPVVVQTPGRRVSPAEAQAKASQEKMNRLRKSGRTEDAAAVIANLL